MTDPVSIAGLGLAAFESGKTAVTSGSFSSTSNTPSYMHESTPRSARWTRVSWPIAVLAFHPRFGFDWQVMKFSLLYECNGYDLRNARVLPNIDASSGMYSSSFIINWGGQAHSMNNEPVAQIIFLINGEWNPMGRGHVSFSGELIISAALNAHNYESFEITSELNWVHARANQK